MGVLSLRFAMMLYIILHAKKIKMADLTPL